MYAISKLLRKGISKWADLAHHEVRNSLPLLKLVKLEVEMCTDHLLFFCWTERTVQPPSCTFLHLNSLPHNV
jgi:hypothetical protein